MLASSRLEGLEPDEDHQKLLQAYIEGTASLDDLLAHARAYAAYMSRPSDGGTYYLLPRNKELLRSMNSTEKIQISYDMGNLRDKS
jgi:hypothetical protein